MKTSNKLLLGAFTLIIVIVLVANFTAKRKMDKVIEERKVLIEQTDTIQNECKSA
jgi:hypothetical protein